MVSRKSDTLFLCPHCGHRSKAFHHVCPECGRPFQRDYIDTRVHPRDPDLTGVVTSRFWARVFLILIVIGAAAGFFMWLFFLF
jgi:predicted amidophosphoribosyltransferase